MSDFDNIDIKYNVRHCLTYLAQTTTVPTIIEKGIVGYHEIIKSHVERELHEAFEAGRKFERLIK